MRRIVFSLELAFAAFTFCAEAAAAQTVAVGPYYATPSWDQTLACTTSATCPRFIVLSNFNNEAVLDRETGLVWEKSPSATRTIKFQLCSQSVTGNRQGWRLPTAAELRSLIDPSQETTPPSAPALPPGHPFIGVLFGSFDSYWTSTPLDQLPGFEVVEFGRPRNPAGSSIDSASSAAWCVRSSQ
jgi:hypothetical protein